MFKISVSNFISFPFSTKRLMVVNLPFCFSKLRKKAVHLLLSATQSTFTLSLTPCAFALFMILIDYEYFYILIVDFQRFTITRCYCSYSSFSKSLFCFAIFLPNFFVSMQINDLTMSYFVILS